MKAQQTILKTGVLGAKGRMGQSVVRILRDEFRDQAILQAAIDRDQEHPHIPELDLVIDFATPAAVKKLLEGPLASHKKFPVFVIGSTAWQPEDEKNLESLSEKTLVLKASNFSEGAQILNLMLKDYAPVLAQLGYDAALFDVHHRHKKDAPSGTALTLAESLKPHFNQDVPIQSVRAGEVVGDHEVRFLGKADRITLHHHAQDRSIFARGAIRAGIWLANQRLNEGFPKAGIIPFSDYFQSLLKTQSMETL